MKKTLLTVLVTLTMVCLFAFGASAYECDYFSIEAPAGYTVTEAENGVQITKGEDAMVMMFYNADESVDFSNLTDDEKKNYDDFVKQTYGALGTISNYESYFDSVDTNASAMAFVFELANPDDASEVYQAEGMLYTEGDVLYHIMVLGSDETNLAEAEAILDTVEFTPDGVAGNEAGAVPAPALPTEPSTEPSTAPAEPETTEAPTEAETTTTEAAADDKDAEDKDDDKGSVDMTVVIIAVAAVAIVAIVAVVIVKKKK